MKVWQGLGYYTRARMMQKAAKTINEQLNGRLPDNYNDLLKIPGIGPYTAAAIASFAYKEVVPVVDGNVIRVLARLFGLYLNPGQAQGIKAFHQNAAEIIDQDQPDIFNQAIMEFGAIHCLLRDPKCGSCPLKEMCYAFSRNEVDALPLKKEKKTSRKRYFHYLIIFNDNQVILRKRDQKDIWRSLYEFPMIETRQPVAPDRLTTLPEFHQVLGPKTSNIIKYTQEFKHILSHQQIFARFYLVCFNGEIILDPAGYILVGPDDIQDYPVPRLLDKFLKEETWSNWKSSYC